jgi:hypothetical protein
LSTPLNPASVIHQKIVKINSRRKIKEKKKPIAYQNGKKVNESFVSPETWFLFSSSSLQIALVV